MTVEDAVDVVRSLVPWYWTWAPVILLSVTVPLQAVTSALCIRWARRRVTPSQDIVARAESIAVPRFVSFVGQATALPAAALIFVSDDFYIASPRWLAAFAIAFSAFVLVLNARAFGALVKAPYSSRGSLTNTLVSSPLFIAVLGHAVLHYGVRKWDLWVAAFLALCFLPLPWLARTAHIRALRAKSIRFAPEASGQCRNMWVFDGARNTVPTMLLLDRNLFISRRFRDHLTRDELALICDQLAASPVRLTTVVLPLLLLLPGFPNAAANKFFPVVGPTVVTIACLLVGLIATFVWMKHVYKESSALAMAANESTQLSLLRKFHLATGAPPTVRLFARWPTLADLQPRLNAYDAHPHMMGIGGIISATSLLVAIFLPPMAAAGPLVYLDGSPLSLRESGYCSDGDDATRRGRPELAEAFFTLCSHHEPDSSAGPRGLAQLALAKGNCNAAIAWARKSDALSSISRQDYFEDAYREGVRNSESARACLAGKVSWLPPLIRSE